MGLSTLPFDTVKRREKRVEGGLRWMRGGGWVASKVGGWVGVGMVFGMVVCYFHNGLELYLEEYSYFVLFLRNT